MKLSKAVREGNAVSVRGDKYIRCSSKAKPVGVFTKGETRRTMLIEEGYVQRTSHPRGIVIYGPINVEVKQ